MNITRLPRDEVLAAARAQRALPADRAPSEPHQVSEGADSKLKALEIQLKALEIQLQTLRRAAGEVVRHSLKYQMDESVHLQNLQKEVGSFFDHDAQWVSEKEVLKLKDDIRVLLALIRD